ncbi:MAG: hypothetical protein IJO42_03085 [Clostridia bacterium]|nr:hypothetical protein [Clostridia bacterium]
MNREQLSDAIGRLDDELVSVAIHTRRRKPWWYSAVAVAACIALVLGGVAVWPYVSPDGDRPAVDTPDVSVTDDTTTTAEQPTKSTVPRAKAAQLAAPSYPEMVKRTDTNLDEWKESRSRQREKINGQTDGMTGFYQHTIIAFLSGNAGENRVYSPLNVYMALSMLAEITEGNSRTQLTELLGVSNLSALRKKNAALWNGVYIDDGLTSSRLGNSLWLDNGGQYAYDADTVDRLAGSYYASVYRGEMGSDAYNKQLQQWMNEQTDGLLKNEVQNVKFSYNTVLALVSTICFKAGWVGKFSEYSTTQETFHTVGGDKTCAFMKTSEKTTAYFGDHYTAVARGLDDGSFRMVFFLPDEDSSVDEVIRDPQMVALLEENTGGIRQRKIKVNMRIPKFDVKADYSLNEGLKSLGVTDIFDDTKSDFGGIVENSDGMYASASHAARVKIDEEGAEGVAFTFVEGLKRGPTAQKEESMDFILDRPFVFAITGPGNTILFAGVVENP